MRVTTIAEIVDVRDVEVGPRDAKTEACVTNALWGVLLPGAFEAEHATWTATSRP